MIVTHGQLYDGSNLFVYPAVPNSNIHATFLGIRDEMRSYLHSLHTKLGSNGLILDGLAQKTTDAVQAKLVEFLDHIDDPAHPGVIITPARTRGVKPRPIQCAWVVHTPQQHQRLRYPNSLIDKRPGFLRTSSDKQVWVAPGLRIDLTQKGPTA